MAGVQALLIQNDLSDPAGLLETILLEHDITYRNVHVEEEDIPQIDYHALIVMGGPQYANEDLPYLVQEKAFIRSTLERDIPYFGMCLGGQLLASVCGAAVNRNGGQEIGFYDVELTPDALRDPLFAGLNATHHKVFQWHNDTFEIPAGAVLLEAGDPIYQQAFRYGRHAYGFQYHPELTPGNLQLWIELMHKEDAASLQLSDFAQRITAATVERAYPIYVEHTRSIFTNFLKLSGLIGMEPGPHPHYHTW